MHTSSFGRSLLAFALLLACSRPVDKAIRVFTVQQRIPTPNATNAWVHNPIVVRFSAPVNQASITLDSLRVSGDGIALGRTVTPVDGDPNALQIELDAVPKVPASVKVTLTDAIADADGNALQVPTDDWTWQYPAWQAPGDAPLQNVSSSDTTGWPAVAVSTAGEIYTAFAETMAGSGASGTPTPMLVVRHWTGATWERLGDPLNMDPSEGIVHRPSIAISAAGTPVVAFNETHAGVATIYVRRWSESAWEPLGAALNKDSTMNANWPVLALDLAGNPIVTWYEATSTTGDGSPHTVLLRRWNSGWETPLVLNKDPTADSIAPRVATDSSGRAVVAYAEAINSVHQIFLKRITWNSDGPVVETFGSAAANYVLNTAGSEADEPWVAVSQDAVYVEYLQWSPTATTHVVRCTSLTRCSNMGGVLLSEPSHRTGAPSIVAQGPVSPVAAWDEWDVATETSGSFVVETWNGLEWTPVPGLPIAMNPAVNSHVPQLAAGGGQLVLVWREQVSTGSGTYNVFLKRYNQ